MSGGSHGPSRTLMYAILGVLPAEPPGMRYTEIQAALLAQHLARQSKVIRDAVQGLRRANHVASDQTTARTVLVRWWRGPVQMADPGGRLGTGAVFAWTQVRKDELKRLRQVEQLSETDIAEVFGTTKGTITGQCSRMGLVSPQTTRRGVRSVRRNSPKPSGAPKLTMLPVMFHGPQRYAGRALTETPRAATSLLIDRPAQPVPRAPEPVATPTLPAMPPRIEAPVGRGAVLVVPCRFPLWGDGKPTHQYCDAPSMPNRSYCAEHGQLTWVKVRRREDDAAVPAFPHSSVTWVLP